MAFASGSVTFRRYRVLRGKHRVVDDAFLAALAANAFGRYGSAADADVEIGWVTPRHVFDVNFAAEKIAAGRFAHFVMRVDRNSVPASILRSYVAIEEQASLEVSGRDVLTRHDRREAKDAARRRAEKEANSGAFRRIAAFPVLYDLDHAVLYFATTGTAANDRLLRLFADTFEAVLEPLNAHNAAMSFADSAGLQRGLADARPAHLVPPPADTDADAFVLDPEDRSHLGREFLAWLWHHVERAEGVFELLDKTDVAASIAKVIRLKCDFNQTGSVLVRADAPAGIAESRAALASGKHPVALGLLLAGRAGEWAFTLDGPRLDVTGLALPPSEEKDAAARMEERFVSIADLAGLIDALYENFLRLRLGSEWPARLRELAQWAAGGAEQRESRPRLVSA